MNAASLLVGLIILGQAGWAPERSTSPPPSITADYDRYAQPAAAPSSVAPPPSIVDRTQTAITESGATLRDGFQAGVDSANQQIQEWGNTASRQLQATGADLRSAAEKSLLSGSISTQSSNPFATTAAPAPPAKPQSRNGVSPPPWSVPAATSAPDWAGSAQSTAPALVQMSPPVMQPVRTDSGWTSVGSQVAAPPLLIPSLTATSNTRSMSGTPAGNSALTLSAPALNNNAPATNGADSWSTSWGSSANSAPATINRSNNIAPRGSANGNDLVPVQSADPQPPATSPQAPAANSWADLWGDSDPWADTRQVPAAATPTAQTPAGASVPVTLPANSPLSAAPANNQQNSPAVAPIIIEPLTGPTLGRGTLPALSTGNELPWLPLLVVSLSLAGSLGANLYLGWSYLDARQRYSSLVRKTADKLRRAATAAA